MAVRQESEDAVSYDQQSADLLRENETLRSKLAASEARIAELDGQRREGRQLLRRMVKYCREDRATTERATRLDRLVEQVDEYLRRTGEPGDILRGDG